MADVKSFLFDYKEVAEALIKQQGIHEGLWGIGIEFGFVAQNVPIATGFAPAAIIPVQKIGLNRWKEANNLTVDAAEVNPAPATTRVRRFLRSAKLRLAHLTLGITAAHPTHQPFKSCG